MAKKDVKELETQTTINEDSIDVLVEDGEGDEES